MPVRGQCHELLSSVGVGVRLADPDTSRKKLGWWCSFWGSMAGGEALPNVPQLPPASERGSKDAGSSRTTSRGRTENPSGALVFNSGILTKSASRTFAAWDSCFLADLA